MNSMHHNKQFKSEATQSNFMFAGWSMIEINNYDRSPEYSFKGSNKM